METEMEEEEEEEKEGEVLHHFYHKHPLSLTVTHRGSICFGCWRYFSHREAAYGCRTKKCGYQKLLHEECAEMPIKIRHPKHPEHILSQKCFGVVSFERGKCAVCQTHIPAIGYYCSSGCAFQIHLRCAQSYTAGADEKPRIYHPSHPKHQLRLLERKHSFRCDACGMVEKGTNSYICSICEYWIHESCASLPTTAQYFHDHPLSLAFRLPQEYLTSAGNKCAICSKDLLLKHWAYHCEFCRYAVHIRCGVLPTAVKIRRHHHPLLSSFQVPQEYLTFHFKCDICRKDLRPEHKVCHCTLCRYVVHTQCAIGTSPSSIFSTSNAGAADDDEDAIQFPINDTYEELIRPFVKRESGGMVIPHEEKIIVTGKYESLNHHHHQLSLISSSSHDQTEELEAESNEDDNDGDHRGRSELICEGCATPIHHKKHEYMSCGECKYFLHLSCVRLPIELHSHPLHHHHKLMLQTRPKREFRVSCHVCRLPTSGFFYACTECDNIAIDIKCASVPNTIAHKAHPLPHHYLMLLDTNNYNENFGPYICGGCGSTRDAGIFFRCDSCRFILCFGCALLPATTTHRWDEHPLLLIYGANEDHPSPFYCEICEEKVSPQTLMYHCRECDQSFHLRCLDVSGEHRNIKFGRQYVVTATCHDPHHPLTYRLITTKLRCDLCHDHVYGRPGFECASCNFVMCFNRCGEMHKGSMEAIDC